MAPAAGPTDFRGKIGLKPRNLKVPPHGHPPTNHLRVLLVKWIWPNTKTEELFPEKASSSSAVSQSFCFCGLLRRLSRLSNSYQALSDSPPKSGLVRSGMIPVTSFPPQQVSGSSASSVTVHLTTSIRKDPHTLPIAAVRILNSTDPLCPVFLSSPFGGGLVAEQVMAHPWPFTWSRDRQLHLLR